MLPKLRTLAARKYLKVDCSMVTPIANAYWKNSKCMSPIAGGVAINANIAFSSEHATIDTGGKLNETRSGIDLSGLKPGQWWWD